MQAIQTGARGLGLLVRLSWDRILFIGAIYICLAFASYLYSL
ncbi:hypothetical protein SAMN05216196_10889 [Lutimaribacter pacificus]|uniref:Uncharacterized protein n=1 Tax=Lutimaribacter pacificus TaxID=391948 RepID=A0A1H0LQ17_9RHOB|nr:hypothetical protein SAMN05216196_10889 [Lutimaribacter pacificus]SHK04644.1 hypothetical protein SAMN05444142_10368 [Lutimaribacter pacificus]